ncbi:MAG TPA: transposase [Rhodospirillales bacterium]|nr:transposase [Rhodospirillales bacterium]
MAARRALAENCVVSVHLGYAAGDFHTLLDGDPYLPEESWHNDRVRCRAAGIPDDVVYRPKWQMALTQYRRAVGNGVRFAWLTFDEGYGGKPPFLRELDACGQNYVGEIPVSFVGWTVPPEILHRQLSRDKRMGRPRKFPRLKVRHTPACEVRDLLKYSPIVRRIPWVAYRVKDGQKGPMVWEAKCVPFWIKDQRGLPIGPHHLLICRSALDPTEVKFFLCNAPTDTPVTTTLLLVAFDRWRIERMFEDSKGELGLDHFEVRRYGSLCRHLLLTCVSHLFLAEYRQCKKNDAELTVRQVWTATRKLAHLWYRGGRCSRNRAESIAAQLAITQKRNAKARRSHRKRTIQRLQSRGFRLSDLVRCQWPKE